MKDLNDVEDLIPKDTIGWILQYQNDENLLNNSPKPDDMQEFDDEQQFDGPDLNRITLPGNFDPFFLQVNYTDTQLSHRFVRFEIPQSGDYE